MGQGLDTPDGYSTTSAPTVIHYDGIRSTRSVLATIRILGFPGLCDGSGNLAVCQHKLWPEKIAQAKAERQRVAKLEERQLELEDRQVSAIEAMSASVQNMALAIVTNNERLSTMIAGHSIHSQETTNAIALMRERTGDRRKVRPE